MQLPLFLIASSLLAMLVPAPALGQNTTVIQGENVRFDYAQVLRVEPVYQVLRATRMEERCDPAAMASDGEPGQLSKIVGAVTGAVKGAVGKKTATAPSSDASDCRVVAVEREFRRPIAFDVDYVYHGSKYRSRLPTDPGNRLRVRISLTPVVPAINAR